jgi:multidrug transporter EmrE-like cation transporter
LVLTDNVAGSPQSVALSGSATGDFCFDPSTTVSVAVGQTAVYSLVVDSPTAYKGSVSLTCAGAPAAATCTIPASVTVPSQFTVSVATVASSVAAPVRRGNRKIPGPIVWMIVVMALVLWGFAAALWDVQADSARALWGKCGAAGVLLLLLSFWMAGCGGGGSGGDPPSVSGTPTGTYSLMLTGTSPNTTAQVTLTLTVH